jgi:hypothetical protein
MPIMFNTIIVDSGLSLKDVRLIRHKDKRAMKGSSIYELWLDNRDKFEWYQSTQKIKDRKKLNAPYWAVFVVNPSNETMFVGIYSVNYLGLLEKDTPMPHMKGIDKAGSLDVYKLVLNEKLSDLIGKLVIDWGPANLAWVQYPIRRNKSITILRKAFQEPEFPGFLNFIKPLSKLQNLPLSWQSVLSSSCGVYLLTCPKTKEQYVGSATGENGFWGRWQDYIKKGHGGNVGLKSREPSDYQVSILEVAGTSSTVEDIRIMEGRWQSKLQSREMGLNKNLASSN